VVVGSIGMSTVGKLFGHPSAVANRGRIESKPV
jgi:hypothetical protein